MNKKNSKKKEGQKKKNDDNNDDEESKGFMDEQVKKENTDKITILEN